MDTITESFAMMLYRRFSGGETVEQLAAAFEIPEERVACRLRAAAMHTERQQGRSDLLTLQRNLAEG
jgi:hypothetical protein